MLRPLSIVLALAVTPLAAASADEMERVPPVTDPVVQKECGACHMAFQPAFLPAASWRAMMGELSNHFGEDAWLPPETAKHVEDWLVAHAGRQPTDAANPPLRITELRWWTREHEHEVSQAMWDKAGSKGNCKACHRDAERGLYEDD